MRNVALFLGLALLAGCASSSTDIIDDRVINCAETQEVMVRLGFDAPGVAIESVGDDQVKFLVEVSNNKDLDIVVKWIRIEQMMTENAPYRFENTYRAFDKLIAEGEDHTFELPSTGRGAAFTGFYAVGDVGGTLAVSVGLANGDTYRCGFTLARR